MVQKIDWRPLVPKDLLNQTFIGSDGGCYHIDKSYNIEWPKDSGFLITLYSCTGADSQKKDFTVVTDFRNNRQPVSMITESCPMEGVFSYIQDIIDSDCDVKPPLGIVFKKGTWADKYGKATFPKYSEMFEITSNFIVVDTIYGMEHEGGFVETIETRIITFKSIDYNTCKKAWVIQVNFYCSETECVHYTTDSHDVYTVLKTLSDIPIKGEGLVTSMKFFEKEFNVKE